MLTKIFEQLIAFFDNLGHIGVFILMAIESSFIPLPSELVIPPAAYLASRGDGNIFLIVIAGTLGSVVGALFNYYLAAKLGRLVIYSLAEHRFAKVLMISPKKVQLAEDYFLKHARVSTFFGRLLPVIRHLISIPAGFSRMELWPFVWLTAAGSFLWCSILAAVGYFFGVNQREIIANLDKVAWAGFAIFVIWAVRYWLRFFKR